MLDHSLPSTHTHILDFDRRDVPACLWKHSLSLAISLQLSFAARRRPDNPTSILPETRTLPPISQPSKKFPEFSC